MVREAAGSHYLRIGRQKGAVLYRASTKLHLQNGFENNKSNQGNTQQVGVLFLCFFEQFSEPPQVAAGGRPEGTGQPLRDGAARR
jgi:hypothetical protein